MAGSCGDEGHQRKQGRGRERIQTPSSLFARVLRLSGRRLRMRRRFRDPGVAAGRPANGQGITEDQRQDPPHPEGSMGQSDTRRSMGGHPETSNPARRQEAAGGAVFLDRHGEDQQQGLAARPGVDSGKVTRQNARAGLAPNRRATSEISASLQPPPPPALHRCGD